MLKPENIGPGKYDDLATHVRETAKAQAVLVVVIGGEKGQGFSAQGDYQTLAMLPELLRMVADRIEGKLVDDVKPFGRFYNRKGEVIPFEQWAREFAQTAKRRVAETCLPDGKWVSTVLIGIDHRFFGDGPPLIFETMCFAGDGAARELDCARYSTEAEAIAGHAVMVAKWTTTEQTN